MVIAAALILTVLSFLVIAGPFFRNGDNSSRAWFYEFGDISTTSGTGRTMVKQLESDYRTGILSKEDYHSLQTSFPGTIGETAEAKSPRVSGLDEEIESRVSGLRGDGKAVADDEVEAMIRQLRRSGKAAADDEIEDKVRQVRQSPGTAKSQSGATGNTRQAKARYCPQCGARVQPGGRFCAGCGERLT